MALMDLGPKRVEIQHGLNRLKRQQRQLSLWTAAAALLLFAALVLLFYLQPLVYGFFGLSLQMEQLHIPASLQQQWQFASDSPDYFVQLFTWLGWLMLKVPLSFFMAFLVVKVLKPLPFFRERLKKWSLRVVTWCIAFMLLWLGLSYWQHEVTREDPYARIIAYQDELNDSPMAQLVSEMQLQQPVASYLLAQTALLHLPVDTNAAIPHVLYLIKAEQSNPDFIAYGFKPEQLWTMQQQLYGKSITPLAQHIDTQAKQAHTLYRFSQWLLWGLNALFALMLMSLALLMQRLKRRIARIQGHFIE